MEKTKKPINKKKLTLILVVCAVLVATAISLGVALPLVKRSEYEKRISDYYNMKVESFIEDNKTAAKGGVVFVGDSITDGYDLNKFYTGLNVLNRGISADTSEGVLKRMECSVYALDPKIVVLLIGINDLGRDIKPDKTIENIRSIISLIHEHCPTAKIIVQSIYPVNEDWSKEMRNNRTPALNSINAALKDGATQQGYIFADVHSVLKDNDGYLIHAYSKDGLHPNDVGYAVISAYLRPIIDALLD